MDSRAGAEIKYSSIRGGISGSLARHVFRYISILTDIAFRENDASPEIIYSQSGEIPDSAKIIIRDGKCFLRQGNYEREALGFDPIKKLADALSLSFGSGPYSQDKLSPSPPDQPTLSEAVVGFASIITDAGLAKSSGQPITIWPAPCSFAVALTHDIDIVRRSIPGGVRLLWKRHLPGGFIALVDSVRSSLFDSPNPYDRIREWIMLENELGLKSTFFAFDGWRHHANDPKYELRWITADLKAIRSSDFELALHTSIGCHAGYHIPESKKALEDAAGIGISGLRPHYLSAFFPQYWRAAAASGFAYSSAFGFDEEIGLIQGIDLPIIPFDKEADKSVDIVEIPIAIMDCGIIGDHDVSSEAVFEKGKTLIDRSVASGGLIVLDWHERTLYGRDYPGWGSLYFRLVEYARSKGAYFPMMSDIAASIMTRFKGRP